LALDAARHGSKLPPENRQSSGIVRGFFRPVMLLTLAAICAEIVQGETTWWAGWGSLVLAEGGFVPTLTRTVPNPRRLGMGADTVQEPSRLARAVCRDHLFSFARMGAVLILQLIARQGSTKREAGN
jgi:hypothetical protein